MKTMKSLILASIAMIFTVNAQDTLINTKALLNDNKTKNLFAFDNVINSSDSNTIALLKGGSIKLKSEAVNSIFGNDYGNFTYEVTFRGVIHEGFEYRNGYGSFGHGEFDTEVTLKDTLKDSMFVKNVWENSHVIYVTDFKLFGTKKSIVIDTTDTTNVGLNRMQKIEDLNVFSYDNKVVFESKYSRVLNVKVMNYAGQLIYSDRIIVNDKMEIEIPVNIVGAYFIRIEDDSKICTKKLLLSNSSH